jgi:predicted transcriptional regulator of viral defense system
MDLFQLAASQHGVFTIHQARASALSERELNRLRLRGVIERLLPEVYRVRAAPVTYHQRLSAATLSIPGALASHRAAARLWQLDAFADAPVEVVTERWQRRHRQDPKIVVHETKDLVAGDMDERFGIPCTSLVRTLVDLPAVAHEFRAGVALDQAHRWDPTNLARVAARHGEVARRGRNGTVALRALLTERGLGDVVDSGFERRALRLIEASDLLRPVTQHQVRDVDFVCYLDLAWPDRLLGMECDSVEHHLSVRAFHWERERRRRLARLGWTILEFTYRDVTQHGPMVIRELRHRLR